MQVPELTDDAVVELAREGGVAIFPISADCGELRSRRLTAPSASAW